ncbi:MAG: AAA family ATPase [Bacteroidetes bacterium]|nr:AAA family ATPase [Bacteroidota bacterium]
MTTVNVLDEILDWSSGRPIWQKDALRRLVEKGKLNPKDIEELTNLCKSHYGLHSKTPVAPLSRHHLRQTNAEEKTISLVSLTHHHGVNSLAEQQKVLFGPQLTIVYGENASGKSGYTRILKRVCRARGAEEILGNIMSGSTPIRPSATIEFEVDGKPKQHQWADQQASDASLSKISVFDRHCASVYLEKPTDVAFRPLGLDLFDKLADACTRVKESLEREHHALLSQNFHFPNVTADTAVYRLVRDLTSLTKETSVRSLAFITDADKTRTKELKSRIHDLQSNNPAKTAGILEIRAGRVEKLINYLIAAEEILSDTAILDLSNAHNQMNSAKHTYEKLHKTTWQSQPLKLTGSAIWRALWNTAKKFSEESAYPKHTFPFTGEKSRCVLCQQLLDKEAKNRLKQFQKFLQTNAQDDYDRKTEDYNKKYERINGITNWRDSREEALKEIKLDNPDLSEATNNCLNTMKARTESIKEALTNGMLPPDELPGWVPNTESLTLYIKALKARAAELSGSNRSDIVSKLKHELNELEARQVLADNLDNVLEEIDKKRRIAAYQLCIKDTRTNAITIKSTDVTTRAVTQQLTSSFENELTSLGFDHVEVQMVTAGGARGVLRHKLQFKRAPGADVVGVASDGEARCLSIASFFAELSTTEEQSAILFDDPVSSLDHMWRRKIAERLVDEARNRQVIVFTHDIYFLHTLEKKGRENGVEVKQQYLRRENTNSGLCSERLPWPAQKVKARIGYLKTQQHSAAKTCREGTRAEYEREAKHIYGLLRETWERAVEEVLLGGVIQRYDPSIQTRRTRFLVDIGDTDIETLVRGMSKCSQHLTGHDAPLGESDYPPDPDELLRDINDLQNWVKKIRRRRNG